MNRENQRRMKKISCLCFSILLLFGCGGRRVSYKLEEGDMKLTITKDYIIIDTVSNINEFGVAEWRFRGTISQSDSAACHELLEKLLKK